MSKVHIIGVSSKQSFICFNCKMSKSSGFGLIVCEDDAPIRFGDNASLAEFFCSPCFQRRGGVYAASLQSTFDAIDAVAKGAGDGDDKVIPFVFIGEKLHEKARLAAAEYGITATEYVKNSLETCLTFRRPTKV